MKPTFSVITLLIALAFTSSHLFAEPAKKKEASNKSVSIFNGKDFAGWKVPKNNIWWTVKDGAIVCTSGPKKKGSAIWTEKEFKNFIVECEFKFDGKGDTGIYLRKRAHQAQIGISGSLQRDMTASMYIPGKGYPTEAEEKPGVKGVKNLLKINDWNAMKVKVVGGTYTIWLNGVKVSTHTEEKYAEKGPIGLQLHGGKVMVAEFRKLKVTEL